MTRPPRYACSTCGVELFGGPCVTPAGQKTKTHSDRRRIENFVRMRAFVLWLIIRAQEAGSLNALMRKLEEEIKK